jgi:aspartyl-tRNA(Asn)/glutamyl-tRNA(Gln) amidotransferase subunit A
MFDLSSVERLAAATRAGALSATDACRAALDAIAAKDAGIHAFVHLDAERALGHAADLDRLPSSSRGVLHGVPIALKDNLCTRGGLTTAASKILAGYRPPYDATVVTRLEQAGAIVVGKTNCDEFAMGSSTENSALGPTRNPVDPTRTPGGSSGGSAAAVAAGMVPAALGSDTGGSIRQPAGLCGVVGLKPTYGRVSRYGLLAFASSLDQIGPFTHTVADAALMLGVLAGADRMDATAADVAVADYSADLGRGLDGVRVGVARDLLEGVDPDVGAAFEASLAAMQAGGASLVAIDLPHAKYAIPVYYLVATAEASSNLARYDGVRYGYRTSDARTLESMYLKTRDEGFGPEVKRRIMLGTYVLSAGYYDAYYLKAQQVRTLIRRDYEAAFERCDVVAMPTSPTPAFRLGERTDDPLQMYLADIFTVSANLTGLPAISVPGGTSSEGLPIGLQLTGRAFDEGMILRAAAGVEAARG